MKKQQYNVCCFGTVGSVPLSLCLRLSLCVPLPHIALTLCRSFFSLSLFLSLTLSVRHCLHVTIK